MALELVGYYFLIGGRWLLSIVFAVIVLFRPLILTIWQFPDVLPSFGSWLYLLVTSLALGLDLPSSYFQILTSCHQIRMLCRDMAGNVA